jgi:hypothetical protein
MCVFLRPRLKRCETSARSGYTSSRVNGQARLRRVSTSGIASSRQTARQVDHMPNAEALADFPRFRPRGRKVAAQQPAAVEPLHALIPALGAASEPLENSGPTRRDGGLSLAKRRSNLTQSRKAAKKTVLEIVEVISIRRGRTLHTVRVFLRFICDFAAWREISQLLITEIPAAVIARIAASPSVAVALP